MLIDFYQARRRCMHAEQNLDGAKHERLGPYLGPDRDRYTPDELAILSQYDFADLDKTVAEDYAYTWYEIFCQSFAADALSETLIESEAAMVPDGSGQPEYVFYTFEGARVLLSWLGAHGINPFTCRPEQLEIFLLGVYPTMLTFDTTELSMDLLEFRAVFDFFSDLGSETGSRCASILVEKMENRILAAAENHDQKVSRGLRPQFPWIRGYVGRNSSHIEYCLQ